MDTAIKECSKCHKVQPLTSFGKDSRYALGAKSYCKSCSSEAVRRSPSQTKARGLVYRPLPHRDSLEAQIEPNIWQWLGTRLPEDMLEALGLVWDAEQLQVKATEVERLEGIIELQTFEAEVCAVCELSKCECLDREEERETPAFVDLASLPTIPGIGA